VDSWYLKKDHTLISFELNISHLWSTGIIVATPMYLISLIYNLPFSMFGVTDSPSDQYIIPESSRKFSTNTHKILEAP
jgi:hypothetical protein